MNCKKMTDLELIDKLELLTRRNAELARAEWDVTPNIEYLREKSLKNIMKIRREIERRLAIGAICYAYFDIEYNETLFEAMVDAELIEPTGESYCSGFVKFPLVRLTEKFKNEYLKKEI